LHGGLQVLVLFVKLRWRGRNGMKVGANSSLNEILALFQGKIERQPIEFGPWCNSEFAQKCRRSPRFD